MYCICPVFNWEGGGGVELHMARLRPLPKWYKQFTLSLFIITLPTV